MYIKGLSLGATAMTLLLYANLEPARSLSISDSNALPQQTNAAPKIARQCPYSARVNRLCQYIYSRSEDTTPESIYSYAYQRIVYEASCVDYESDSDEEISRKFNEMWQRYNVDSLQCGPMGIPSTGSPLRYSIHLLFDDFIADHISLWKIDLNKIENGQTTLDFIDWRISKASGPLRSNLERYRRSLVQAGAKNSRDLP